MPTLIANGFPGPGAGSLQLGARTVPMIAIPATDDCRSLHVGNHFVRLDDEIIDCGADATAMITIKVERGK